MASNSDWLPSREQDLADLCKTWDAGLSSRATAAAFGWDEEACTETHTRISAFLSALDAYNTDDSSKNLLIKQEARDAARHSMREFANSSIRHNRKMSDGDRLDYGIRPPDPKPSPAPKPETHPEPVVDTSTLRQIKIRFVDSAARGRAKPPGIHGAEIRWALLDHPPVSEEELVKSDFDTASPFTLSFDEGDRGRRLYFAMRWETMTNLKGPFSEIYSAIIP
jgi:hypothetical protein